MSQCPVSGRCLCKKVSYAIEGHLGIFQYCHCSRCRKFTGSAFAANLLVSPADFRWTGGEEFVGRYESRTPSTLPRLFASIADHLCRGWERVAVRSSSRRVRWRETRKSGPSKIFSLARVRFGIGSRAHYPPLRNCRRNL